MARLETFQPENFQSNAVEAPFMRKWLFRALIMSIVIHAALILWFRSQRLERFNVPAERLVAIRMLRPVEINPKLLENDDSAPEPPKPAQQKMPEVKPVDLPDEKPSAEKPADQTRMTPAAPDVAQPIAIPNEKPSVNPSTMQNIKTLPNTATPALDKDLAAALDKQLLRDVPSSTTKSLLNNITLQGKGASGDADAAGMAAASSRLDGLLKGGFGSEDSKRPLQLPGGALFEFGSAELKPVARENLGKLGLLLKKYPKLTFSIEGHADSFGDEKTNDALSLARAESVRTWLVQNMDVDPSRIEVKGFGKSKFVVAPRPYNEHSQASIDAEKLRQQPNRRVEIVFRFPSGQ